MADWKGAFVAVLMSGIVVGILNGHLAIWTGVGAALGAILAARERRNRSQVSQIGQSQDRGITQFAGKQ